MFAHRETGNPSAIAALFISFDVKMFLLAGNTASFKPVSYKNNQEKPGVASLKSCWYYH